MSMDFFSEPEIPQGPNWFSHPPQNNPHKMMEISPFHGFFDEFNTIPQLQYESNKLSYFNEFDDLENFNFDFNLPPLDEHFEVDQNPLKMLQPEPSSLKTESNGFVASVKKEFEEDNEEEMQLALMALPPPFPSEKKKKKKKKRSSNALEFDEIKKHFDVPISVAAKKMNVGLTHLKRRCRELKITKWPHRKLKSLELLINNLKELGMANEVAMLEKQKEMLENFPSMDLNQETKKLRQACFKANYKRRRFMTPSPSTSTSLYLP